MTKLNPLEQSAEKEVRYQEGLLKRYRKYKKDSAKEGAIPEPMEGWLEDSIYEWNEHFEWVKSIRTPKTTGKKSSKAIHLNTFDLPDHPPSAKQHTKKLSDKVHARALAKALIPKAKAAKRGKKEA